MPPRHIPITKAFGEALRSARNEVDLTQRQLAEAAAVDPTYVTLLEGAKRHPGLSTVLALERALKLPPGELSARTVVRMKKFSARKNPSDQI